MRSVPDKPLAVEDSEQKEGAWKAREAFEVSESSSYSEDEDEDEEYEDKDKHAIGSDFSHEESSDYCQKPDSGDTAQQWDMPAYGDGAKYWDAKHAEDKNPHEWMQGYEDLSKLIAKCTDGSKDHRVLHVGCGSSLLTEKMYDDGYREIVNIDISSVVIEKMRRRNKELRPKMKWLVMDAAAMEFENGVFNFVIDKCTIDTLVCCNNSNVVVGKYLQEVVRILKDDGVYLALTFGKPAVRMSYLKKSKLNFQVEVMKVPVPYTKSKFHFAYVCRKGTSLL